MSPKHIGATVAAGIVTPWLLVVITLYVFRLVLCASVDVQRKASPDGRTVAVERDEACLINHATAVYLERGGLPRTTLVWAMVERVQGVELTWHGDHELWVTLEASARRRLPKPKMPRNGSTTSPSATSPRTAASSTPGSDPP